MNKLKSVSISWFQVFKYLVYGLLALDVYFFFVEEFSATSFRFAKGLNLSEIIVAYSGTIDTAAWVILLIVFELETYVIDDEVLKKRAVKWSLNFISFLSYAVIVYSFYAYNQKLFWTFDFQQIADAKDVCGYIGQSWLEELDHYVKITPENCSTLATTNELWAIPDQQIIADAHTLKITKNLAWTDVLNSAAWLLVVIVLEIDVWLQLKNKLKGTFYIANQIVKIIAYIILLLAAIYWGYTGQILDFWDALLWIVSFLFIEMNLFKWHEETTQEDAVKERLI